MRISDWSSDVCSSDLFYPLDPQIKAGRVVDADTIIWWMTQPDEARRHFLECASDDPEELPALLKNLEMMFRDLTKNRPYKIYANSPNFDCTIMKSLYNDHGMTIPCDFRKERDLRTLCSMAGINAKEVAKVSGFVPHNAYRSEEHTSELQSLMRISYAVSCLKKKKQNFHLH